jgi:trk system potassium uptake protein TrkH
MNTSIIRFILGHVLRIEGMLFLLPALTGIIYREDEALAYILMAAITFLLGFAMTIKKPKDTVFYLKEGCVTTALSWIIMSLFGCIPFMLTGEIPDFVDAYFEMVSGFTTTGASILKDVEAVSHASLMWRSFSHWRHGRAGLPARDHSTHRRIKHKPHAGGISRSIGRQAGPQDEEFSEDPLSHLCRSHCD